MEIRSVLKRITPGKTERKKDLELANRIVQFIENKYGLEARLVGSIAKGTYLKGKKDMDIFVLFPREVGREELERKGLEIGKSVAKFLGGKAEKHYAEHPYTRVLLKDRVIEIVPAYKISPGERILSAVDRTPLHTDYVLKKLKNPEDVILLKWFMKEIGVYGAEIKTRGFSGYLCELLVIYYGSFERVIEEASVWEPPIVIDPEDHYSCVEEILSKFEEPLIVVDPVDPKRNVAAPVSLDCLAKFVLASRMLIKTGKLPRKAGINVKNRKMLVVRWKISKENEEIVWSQLEAMAKRICRALEDYGFRVMDIGWWTDSEKVAEVILDLEVWKLPEVEERMGPSVFDFKNSEKFIEKYKKVYVKNGRLWAERKRKYSKVEDVLRETLKQSPKHLGKRWRIINAGRSKILKTYSKKMWKW